MALFSLPLKGELTVHHTTATSTAPRFTTSFDIIPSTAHLSNQLGNTARLLDLLLSVPAEVAGTDDNRDLGDTALAQDLGVAEGEEVDDRGGVGLLAAHVGFALLGRDEGPQLFKTIQSATCPPQYISAFPPLSVAQSSGLSNSTSGQRTLSRLMVGLQYCWSVLR